MPVLQQDDPPGEAVDELVIVGDEQDGGASVVQLPQETHHLLQVAPILTKRWLVENQEARPQGKTGC